MLEELFYNKDIVKTIEHFVIHEKWEQNRKEMCEILKIHTKEMEEILSKLVQFNIVKISKTIGQAKFYLLTDNPLVKYIRLLSQEFGAQRALEEMKRYE